MSTIEQVVAPPLRTLARGITWGTARRFAWSAAIWIGLYVAALVIFGAFVAVRGADPFAMYGEMWDSITSSYGFAQLLNRAAPFMLAGLAVAVPARAGLVNIGGEGQLLLGATAAGGVYLALGSAATHFPGIVLMMLAAVGAGAAWAGLAAVLRLAFNVNEAITTLLLNYVAANILLYLVFGPWKDAAGNGQPASKPLEGDDYLPTLGFVDAHVGIAIGLGATLVAALVLRRTRWGFALRAVGGNPEAARRAGLAVGALLLSAMLVGGALAGLGGAVHYVGMEGQLRPGLAATFGYIGFLASWLGRHSPAKVALASILVATIAVAGDSLQFSTQLPGSAVYVLMAIVLLAVLARRPAAWKGHA